MESALIISNILLWGIVIIMALVIFALLRQIGILYERVAPAGALMLNNKLKVGADAPELPVKDIQDNVLQLGGKPAEAKSQLLYFISPDCPVCKSLLPIIKSAAKSESKWLDIVLASDGQEHDHQAFVKQQELDAFPYVVSELLGKTYGVSKLPFGVLIDEQGKIASMGIINSREHLESLFEAKEREVASIQDYMDKQRDDLYTEVR